MPLIIPANTLSAAGYDIANSCRFDGADSLQRSKGTQSSLQIGTYSFWVKRTNIDGTQHFVYSNTVADDNNRGYYSLRADEKFRIVSTASSGDLTVETSQLFRDPSAWMNIVVRIDTTQSTAANRCIFYVNGVAVTALDTTTYPDQNANLKIFEGGESNKEFIGSMTGETANLHCYLSEFVYCDGQSLAPTSFGEFNEDSPTIWQPINVSGLTFGDQGFYLDFEDSSALGNSSNSNNFGTVNNLAATDSCTDSPTNNFCTLNPLGFTEGTLSEGNTEIDQNGSAGRFCAGTIQPSNGKWYFEAKVLNYGADPRHFVGVGRNEETYTGTASAATSSIGYSLETQSVYKGNSVVLDLSSADSPATDDIYMIAYDIDNLKIYLGKNGTWLNSGDPAGGSGNVTTLVSGTDYAPITGALNASSNSARNNDWQFNFGNPTFAISSSQADDNGYGNFEYDVPAGYYALCTKNLAEFG